MKKLLGIAAVAVMFLALAPSTASAHGYRGGWGGGYHHGGGWGHHSFFGISIGLPVYGGYGYGGGYYPYRSWNGYYTNYGYCPPVTYSSYYSRPVYVQREVIYPPTYSSYYYPSAGYVSAPAPTYSYQAPPTYYSYSTYYRR